MKSFNAAETLEIIRSDVKDKTLQMYSEMSRLVDLFSTFPFDPDEWSLDTKLTYKECVPKSLLAISKAKDEIKERAKVLHVDIQKIIPVDYLESIFTKNFLLQVVHDIPLSDAPAKLSISDLIPYQCNFPATMTSRQKLYKDKGHAPCTKSVGKNIFFCSVKSHMLYAKRNGLPITALDCVRMDIEIPQKSLETKRTHLRFKIKQGADWIDVNRPEKNGRALDLEEKVETVGPPMKKMKIVDDSLGEDLFNIEKHCNVSCSFCCPITYAECHNEGKHYDSIRKGHTYFCDQHVRPESLLQKISLLDYIDDNADALKWNLDQIVDLDKELGEDEQDFVDERMQKLTKRYQLAIDCSLGTRADWVDEIRSFLIH